MSNVTNVRGSIYFLIGAVFLLRSVDAGAAIGTAIGTVRFTSTGALDPGFGTGGGTINTADGAAGGVKFVPFSNGKTISVGYIPQGSSIVGIIGRTNADGTPDTSFGYLGINLVDFSTSTKEYVTEVGFQSDLKIIVGGTALDGNGNGRMFVARYLQNGVLDTSFGVNGFRTAFTNGVHRDIFGMVVQADDKIVIAGRDGDNIGLARFTKPGALDNTFSGDGLVETFFTTAQNSDSASSVDTDGDKIVISVHAIQTGSFAGAMRFTSTGALDTGYNGGRVVLNWPQGNGEVVNEVYCKPTVGCFFVGATEAFGGMMALTQLTTTGTVNPAFGYKAFQIAGTNESFLTGVQVGNDNKLYVGGRAEYSNRGAPFSARFSLTGVSDSTYGVGGVAAATFAGLSVSVFEANFALDPVSTKVQLASTLETFP